MKSKITIQDQEGNVLVEKEMYPKSTHNHIYVSNSFGSVTHSTDDITVDTVNLSKDEKALFLFLSEDKLPISNPICFTIESTEKAISNNQRIIFTTQPHFCNSEVIVDKGYRVFVYMLDGNMVEIKMGSIEGYCREIRYAHNLQKLLLANAFGLARNG